MSRTRNIVIVTLTAIGLALGISGAVAAAGAPVQVTAQAPSSWYHA